MIDFAEARQMMVDGQIRTSDVTDRALIEAFLDVPRELFVPAPRASIAYLDRDIPVSDRVGNRCLIRPMVLAKLIQAADVRPADQVLIVGCATGYSAAIVARLAGSVVALEEDPDLAQTATKMAQGLGHKTVKVVRGPLSAGWAAEGPYDLILIDGAVETVPEALFTQLKPEGRLLGVVRQGPVGKATVFRASGPYITTHALFDAPAPLLPGFARTAEFVF